MSKLKVANLVGARPQFIKASAISRVLRRHADEVEEILIHSGQHYDSSMSDVFFDELEITPPKYHLEVGSGTHGEQTANILVALEKVLLAEKPDAIVVYGDTNTTLAGGIVAAKLNIPIAHVEAGLRSFNLRMPEEINRKAIDHLSKWLFCPTQRAVDLLHDEGIGRRISDKGNSQSYVLNTGDVMLDVANWASNDLSVEVERPDSTYVVFTLHRDFNTDNPERLSRILEGVASLSNETPVIFPVHPRTAKAMTEHQEQMLIDAGCDLRSPLAYKSLMKLVKHSSLVITDSGGLQKEAYFLQKPVVIPRAETEWMEMVDIGCAALADDDSSAIVSKSMSFIHQPPTEFPSLYGDGRSADIMVSSILSYFS